MVDRSAAPAFTPPGNFSLPQPEIISLDNGCRFYLLKAGDQPVLKLEFIFKAGIRFENKPGVALFTSKMLKEGTKHYSSREISETLDRYGAFVDIHPGFDYSNISIHIPTDHLDKILDVVSDMLFNPVFPEQELKILKQIQTQQLRVNNQKNSFVASRLFRSKLFHGSPYCHVLDEDAITAVKRSHVEDFFNHWMNGKFDLFLTGSFTDSTKNAIISLIEKKLTPPHNFQSLKFEKEQYFQESIDKNESLQSSIYIGNKSLNRSHQHYPGLLLINEVFGGYFGSRLMQNIREDKGYTYSIYSHIASFRDDAYFVISGDVKKAFKDHALAEINNEIERITSEPIDIEELNRAKNYLKGSILNTLTNPFAITEKLKNIYFYSLGERFYDHLFYEIDRLQPDKLLQLANSHLFERPLSSVIVG